MNSLLDAIHWQRRQRPSFGEIAVESGCLMPDEAGRVLKNKSYGERFGDCAVRLGFINSFQFRSILEKQQGMHIRIGQYFSKNRILTISEIDEAYKNQVLHNSKFTARKLLKSHTSSRS